MTCKLIYMSASMLASKYSSLVSFQSFYSSVRSNHLSRVIKSVVSRFPNECYENWNLASLASSKT